MKFKNLNKWILAVASLCLMTLSAQAGADVFAGVRTLVVDAPRLISGGGAGIVTNSWVDIHGFEGIAKLDIASKTNAAGGTLTLKIETSDDQTNVTTLANVAYATAASVIITNVMYGGTNLTATDVFNIPGVITVPTPATAGWATPYIVSASFTNTVSALSVTADGVQTLGFNISDTKRYLRLIYSPASAATNSTVSATLTGIRHAVP